MKGYTASIQQSKETVLRFCQLQYNVFQTKRKLGVMLICAAFVAFSLAMISSYTAAAVALLFLACIIYANIDAPAQYTGNQVAEMFHGKFPKLEYSFSGGEYRVSASAKPVKYAALIRLVEDDNYLYLFQTPQYGIMVSKSTVEGPDGENGLKKLLAEKTGLKWKKELPVFTRKLTSLFRFESPFRSKLGGLR